MRKLIRKIITEDADAFEQMIKYASDKDKVKKDAKEFAEMNAGDEEQGKEWLEQFNFAYEDELQPYASTMDATFEDLEKYGIEDDGVKSTDKMNDKQKLVVEKMAEQEDLQGYMSLYKAACNAFDVPTMNGTAFLRNLREKGAEGMGDYLFDQWEQAGAPTDVPELYLGLIDRENFDPKVFGLPGKEEDSPPATFEENIEEVEDELDDVESQLEEFGAGLEEFIEAAYKAKDTEEYKSLVKDFQLQEKYRDFVLKLFNKIMDFAKSKDRDDVVEIANNNLGVFNSYVGMQRDKNYEFRKQLAADDEGYSIDDTSGGNPSQKTIKGMAKAYKAQIEDFKKIVGSIKKNPLKKMDKENILKESSRRLDRVLMEIKIQQYTRKRLNGKLNG